MLYGIKRSLKPKLERCIAVINVTLKKLNFELENLKEIEKAHIAAFGHDSDECDKIDDDICAYEISISSYEKILKIFQLMRTTELDAQNYALITRYKERLGALDPALEFVIGRLTPKEALLKAEKQKPTIRLQSTLYYQLFKAKTDTKKASENDQNASNIPSLKLN